jgi:alpha-L-rhamnosidase
MNVTNVRCELCVNPLGLDTLTPRFSWIPDDAERGQRQSAYQVLVAGHPDVLRTNTGDLWDSGKVFSDQSVNIAYAGQPLASRQRCYWRVRVWDKAGSLCPDSPSATFEMGLLRPEDWHVKWFYLNCQ